MDRTTGRARFRPAVCASSYGGTVNQFTGDGIMAVFGAPMTLEDHAFRACLAALEIQTGYRESCVEVKRRDGIDFRLRIGLNSGQVIAGEIGSSAVGYTAIGEQVGMAQRMESVAPPGGVMLSESTARLVENAAVLGDPELVQIKGIDEPVRARQLLAIGERRAHTPHRIGIGRAQLGTQHDHCDLRRGHRRRRLRRHCCRTTGYRQEQADPRIRRDRAPTAGWRSSPHTASRMPRDIPFHVVARLLRAGIGINDLDSVAARTHVHAQLSRCRS